MQTALSIIRPASCFFCLLRCVLVLSTAVVVNLGFCLFIFLSSQLVRVARRSVGGFRLAAERSLRRGSGSWEGSRPWKAWVISIHRLSAWSFFKLEETRGAKRETLTLDSGALGLFFFIFFTSCLTSVYNLSVMADQTPFPSPYFLNQTCTVQWYRSVLYILFWFDPLCVPACSISPTLLFSFSFNFGL